jgi:hypothetical protein
MVQFVALAFRQTRLPGMRWSVAGTNRRLRFRSAWASGTLDEEFAAFLAPPNARPARPGTCRPHRGPL